MRYSRYWVNREDSELAVLREYMRLAKHEPRLLELLTDIMEAQPTTDDWYVEGWKRRVTELVGWHRSRDLPEISGDEDYDTVYTLCYSYCFDPPAEDEAQYG